MIEFGAVRLNDRVAPGLVAADDFGEAEIEQFDAGRGHQGVGGFEVAVDEFPLMGGIERIEHLAGVLERGRPGEWSRKRTALEVFHYEVIRSNVVQGTNVRMIQGGDGTHFGKQAVAICRLRHFDRDGPTDSSIAGFEHLAHAAGAQEFDDLVRAEARTGGTH